MGKRQLGGGGGKKSRASHNEKPNNKNRSTTFKKDVFEAIDEDPDEDKKAGQRYDLVDNYEYELPSDFEDEEIDEDEAFNSEDERLYGHFFADKGDQRDRSGGESEEYSDDLLDSDEDANTDDSEYDDEELEEEEEGLGRRKKPQEDSEDVLSGSEAEQEPSEDEAEYESDDEQLAGGNVDLSYGDQEEEEEEDAGAAKSRPRKRRRDLVHTEAYPESEFNLPTSGTEGELTLTDLIAGLGDSKTKLGSAKKDLERMQRKAAPVAVPLPGPIQKRQERKAGYEEAKKDINKWMPIVKANREAPTLRFTADTAAVPRTVSTAALAAKHAPETAMEAEVAALLEAAGAHTSKAVAEAEEALALKELTVEEAQERRNRLAKMRALLFYHEVKAKRLKKIKSKEYRRKLKKAKKRKAVGLEDGEDFDEDALRQEQEDAEFERAKERLTLKHKNTSRFIRRALKRGLNVMDDGTRDAVTEQLRLGQELRQKALRMRSSGNGSDSDNDGSTSASDSDHSDDERGPQSGKTMSGKARKAALDILEGRAEPEEQQSGLFALPFMKRALEKQRLEAEAEARAFLENGQPGFNAAGTAGQVASGGARRKFSGDGGAADALAQRVQRMEEAAFRSDDDGDSDEEEDAEAKAERLGRKIQGLPTPEPASKSKGAFKGRQQDHQDEDEDDLDVDAWGMSGGGLGKETTTGGFLSVDLPQRTAAGTSGSVLETVAKGKSRVSQQDHLFKSGTQQQLSGGKKATVEATIGPAPVSKAGKGAEEQQKKDFIATRIFKGAQPGYVFKKGPKGLGYYLDAGATPTKSRGKANGKPSTGNLTKKAAAADSSEDEEGSGAGVMKPQSTSAGAAGNAKSTGAGLSQEELVRRAFAGDDVVAEFEADKAVEVEGELPQEEVAGVLPGWGTWAGNQKEPKWVLDAKRKAQHRKETAALNRKDAKLQYVIISEKWDKRASKYRTPSVPYPFDSKETYERAMRQPLGQEYNTDAAFRNLTRPAVIKDAGVIIEPIRFSKGVAEHDSKAPKNSRKAAIITVAGGMPKRQKTAKK